jgi:acyl dehydratase
MDPSPIRFLDDYLVGDTYSGGSYRFTEESIISFARQFDPQWLHLNPRRAEAGPFNGLIASGFHTASVMMRLYLEVYLDERASLASPGLDELRWPAPVRPGDTVQLRCQVQSVRPSNSKPERGVLVTNVELVDQSGETKLSALFTNFVLRRQ